jgi:hypothetical protein
MSTNEKSIPAQPGDVLRFAEEYRALPIGSICAATGKAPWHKISDEYWAQHALAQGVLIRQASELLAEHRVVLRVGETITVAADDEE